MELGLPLGISEFSKWSSSCSKRLQNSTVNTGKEYTLGTRGGKPDSHYDMMYTKVSVYFLH